MRVAFLATVIVFSGFCFTTTAADLNAGIDNHNGLSANVGTSTDSGNKPRIILRGWEVQKVSAAKKASLTEVLPQYQNRRRVGDLRKGVLPKKGGFLVVQVDCAWATLSPPNEPLWVGKPDLTLIDEIGFEYAASGQVVVDGADLVTPGMVIAPKGRGRGEAQDRDSKILVYFEVPAVNNTQAYWVRFSDGGPLVPVSQVSKLSTEIGGSVVLP